MSETDKAVKAPVKRQRYLVTTFADGYVFAEPIQFGGTCRRTSRRESPGDPIPLPEHAWRASDYFHYSQDAAAKMAQLAALYPDRQFRVKKSIRREYRRSYNNRFYVRLKPLAAGA